MGLLYLVLVALLLTLLPMPWTGQAANAATVREDQVALRSRASGGATAMMSPGRGQKIKVGFSISGSEGSWRSVTEEGPGGASAYGLCAQLNRPLSEKRPEGRSAPSLDFSGAGQRQIPEPGQPVASVAAAQNPSEAKVNELLGISGLASDSPSDWFTGPALGQSGGESGLRSAVQAAQLARQVRGEGALLREATPGTSEFLPPRHSSCTFSVSKMWFAGKIDGGKDARAGLLVRRVR